MYNKNIRKATTERSLKTLIQTFVALTAADSLGAVSTSASANLKISLGAAVLSVLTSAASRGFGGFGPSLSTETVAPTIIEVPAPSPEPELKVTVSTDPAKAKAKATATASAKKPVKKATAKKAPAKKTAAKKTSTASAKKKTK